MSEASAASASLPTNGTVESRLGPLQFEGAYPTPESVARLYDVETRRCIDTPHELAGLDSRKKLVANADGSVDLHFGPTAPAGKESDWLPTLPGRGWFALFRFYAPTEPYFDRSWSAARHRTRQVTDRVRGWGWRTRASSGRNPRLLLVQTVSALSPSGQLTFLPAGRLPDHRPGEVQG